MFFLGGRGKEEKEEAFRRLVCTKLVSSFVHAYLRKASSFLSCPLPRTRNTKKPPNFVILWLPPRKGCGFVEARGLFDSGLASP